MEIYSIEDQSFDGSREYKLIDSIVNAIEEKNREEFTKAVSEFN